MIKFVVGASGAVAIGLLALILLREPRGGSPSHVERETDLPHSESANERGWIAEASLGDANREVSAVRSAPFGGDGADPTPTRAEGKDTSDAIPWGLQRLTLRSARASGLSTEEIATLISSEVARVELERIMAEHEAPTSDAMVAISDVAESIKQEYIRKGMFETQDLWDAGPNYGNPEYQRPKPGPLFEGQHVCTEVQGGMRKVVRINPGENPELDEARRRYSEAFEARRSAILGLWAQRSGSAGR
ncbi:MAG: hypothetical protein IPN34_21785 [Planctomycetes bacterium]|nr:hypothetical protein [Planctomycetota bacterium]